jgi:MFS-type transporter involved in bile tolerance (Atg22 family)
MQASPPHRQLLKTHESGSDSHHHDHDDLYRTSSSSLSSTYTEENTSLTSHNNNSNDDDTSPVIIPSSNNNPPEVTGLALDMFARGTIFMSSIFLGPALLELATEAAPDAGGRLYGFRPSSLLSNMAMVSGLLASISLPIVGAMVDHTRYRRELGQYTAYGLAMIKTLEIMVSSSTWMWVASLQVVTALLYQPHLAATYAYTSELSTDSAKHTYYNSWYAMMQQISFLQFCILVLGLGMLLHTTTVGTARISQTVTSLTSAPLFFVAWKYFFRPRPALKEIPPNTSLWNCGFLTVTATCGKLRRQARYRPLVWLLASILFSEAAVQALVAIATTYMTVVLEMTAHGVGVCFLAVLICGIPGAKLGAFMAEHWYYCHPRYFCLLLRDSRIRPMTTNPVHSVMVAQVYFVLVTSIAGLVLKRPDDQQYVPIFGCLWGLALGWLSPMLASSFMGLVQQQQHADTKQELIQDSELHEPLPQVEAEIMGLYLLASNALSWLPALIFTILNEANFDMKWGMLSLNIYFVVGFVCLVGMGDYEVARATMLETTYTENDEAMQPAMDEVELDMIRPII